MCKMIFIIFSASFRHFFSDFKDGFWKVLIGTVPVKGYRVAGIVLERMASDRLDNAICHCCGSLYVEMKDLAICTRKCEWKYADFM